MNTKPEKLTIEKLNELLESLYSFHSQAYDDGEMEKSMAIYKVYTELDEVRSQFYSNKFYSMES